MTDLYDDDQSDPPEYKGPWVVCLYFIDRAYGGAEEGGWYYECGAPEVTSEMRAFDDYDEACDYARALNNTAAAELNEGRPSIGSVLSRGCYEYQVCDGLPEPYPKHRPYYE